MTIRQHNKNKLSESPFEASNSNIVFNNHPCCRKDHQANGEWIEELNSSNEDQREEHQQW